jgi:LytS/YehU family sensor histidine kinase
MDNCNLNIYFNPLSFNNLKNHYEYRISSNNTISEWFKNDGTVANILLSGYGEHLVEVKAVTENDIASPIQTIHVILHPPFYRSWWFMATMVIAVLVIVFLSFILYTRRRKKIFEHELEFMQLEHKAINSLLDPHFTFNAINNIQNVIVSGDQENANEYLAILSRLIRQNMENLQFSFIPLEKELKLIEHYVYLQNLRFGDKITLHVTRQNVDADEVSIPPLLIHTFVENAIVHGFIKDTPLHIAIDLLISEEKYLQIIVTDDGRGFKAKKEDTSDKLSLGIDFMRKRLERMSKFYGVFYSLNITNLEVAGSRGTEVTIIVYAQMEHLNKKR